MKDWKVCIVCQWAILHNMLSTDVSLCVSSGHRKSRVEFSCPSSENLIELQHPCAFPYQIIEVTHTFGLFAFNGIPT